EGGSRLADHQTAEHRRHQPDAVERGSAGQRDRVRGPVVEQPPGPEDDAERDADHGRDDDVHRTPTVGHDALPALLNQEKTHAATRDGPRGATAGGVDRTPCAGITQIRCEGLCRRWTGDTLSALCAPLSESELVEP